jgi:hypothetical protein
LVEDGRKIFPSIPVSRLYVKGEIGFHWNWQGILLPDQVLFSNQRHYLFEKLGICGWGDLRHVSHSKSHTKREWKESGLKVNTTIKYKI